MKHLDKMAWLAGISLALGALGCDEVPGDSGGTAGAGGGTTSSATQDPFTAGTPLDVEVPAEGRVFVDLNGPALAKEIDDWELAFEGRDIFTNGGDSGIRKGSAFGPLDLGEFLNDDIPEHPFMIEDESGSAFAKWYAYDSSVHVLYGRYHVYGVKHGEELYKVQVLGFYGEVAGAPVAAIYSLRFAHVTSGGVEATTTLMDVDATAGGSMGKDTDPSACLTLSTGEVKLLLPADAAESTGWDLCFRRANILINGTADVLAVDLDRDKTDGEKLEDVMKLTADSELARFDAVTYADLSKPDLPWSGDRVLSAFTDHWTVRDSSPLELAKVSWLVAGADGITPFLVLFESLKGATAEHPGTVRMRVRLLDRSL